VLKVSVGKDRNKRAEHNREPRYLKQCFDDAVTVKRAATSVNPNPHETLLSVFLADIRLSVDSETFARAFGLPTSTGSIPSRATEFTMMIRLASAGLSEVLPVLCDVIAPSDDTVPVSEIVYPSDGSLVAHS
jgi:hypothetical protein